jgi:hypothetical protein
LDYTKAGTATAASTAFDFATKKNIARCIQSK